MKKLSGKRPKIAHIICQPVRKTSSGHSQPPKSQIETVIIKLCCHPTFKSGILVNFNKICSDPRKLKSGQEIINDEGSHMKQIS